MAGHATEDQSEIMARFAAAKFETPGYEIISFSLCDYPLSMRPWHFVEHFSLITTSIIPKY